MKKDFLSILDLSREEIVGLIDDGLLLKNEGPHHENTLTGCVLGLLFDKASTRTRVSFETAMFRLGGQTTFLGRADTQLSRDEPVRDTARVLSGYLDALAVRTYSQDLVEEMARWANIPIINALTDLYHPCQILSDMMTIKEKRGSLEKLKVAWIGDGNNVAHSWINASYIMGFELVLACPPGYHPNAKILERAGSHACVVEDPQEAVEGADVINTDVWASMGQEEEKAQRIVDFKGYQVNQSLIDRAHREVLVMHCLPAHRGEEITSDVLTGPNSVIFDQAENKMHLHRALLKKMVNIIAVKNR